MAMRILVVGQSPRVFGPGNFQWPDDTVRALRRLGHRVRRFRYRESWAASPALSAGLQRLPLGGRLLKRYQQAHACARDKALTLTSRQWLADLVLFLNGDAFSGEVLAEVRRWTPGRLVSWWADNPCASSSFMRAVSLFDHVFVFDRSYLAPLIAAGGRSVHFLPCACDETIYRPLRLSQAAARRFRCEVAFVAWYYPERAAVVKALARSGIDVGVWGGQWRSDDAQRALEGARVARGAAVSDRTAARIYSAATIGLNIHATHSVSAGVNTRTFELLASGAFQLIDRIAGIEELLTPGREVVCYASPEEACVLAKRYLADPDGRAAIASRGRERALAEHTYVCRMRTLLNAARAS